MRQRRLSSIRIAKWKLAELVASHQIKGHGMDFFFWKLERADVYMFRDLCECDVQEKMEESQRETLSHKNYYCNICGGKVPGNSHHAQSWGPGEIQQFWMWVHFCVQNWGCGQMTHSRHGWRSPTEPGSSFFRMLSRMWSYMEELELLKVILSRIKAMLVKGKAHVGCDFHFQHLRW